MLSLSQARVDIEALRQADHIDIRVLAANTNETHTKPNGASWVLVVPDKPVWVKVGGAAAVPAADVTDGTGPIKATDAGRLVYLGATTTFGLITADAGGAIVSLEFFGQK